MSLICQFL